MGNKMRDTLIADRTLSLQAHTRAFMRPIADLLYEDTHYWGARPCPTCRTITSLIGEPFGCIRFAINKGHQQEQGDG